ncbi:MAG: sigma 54-interacting transcriptional regulator [Planctomycetota bacterium]
MVAFLTFNAADGKQKQFHLDPDRPSHIGRAVGCEVMLSDPNASRYHAVLYYEDHSWHLRDTDSRNGTLVNGGKVDTVRLADHNEIVIGKTVLRFSETNEESVADQALSQTVYGDVGTWKDSQPDSIRESSDKLVQDPNHLLDLYQLSVALLDGNKPDEIVETTLELLKQTTQSQQVALIVDGGEGRLKVRRQIPDAGVLMQLDRGRVRRVIRHQETFYSDFDATDSGPFHLMVPLSRNDISLGALVMQRAEEPFDNQIRDLSAAAASLLAIGMSRTSLTENLLAENKRIADRNADQGELLGESRPMVRLKERLARVASASGSVLIRGESGSGKELVARAVHAASNRADRPMLSVNCAAIPQDLIESQLFGHRRGAFTGADNDHDGLFKQADQGTLFLDEIGELTLEGQAKMLRILEGHPFLPVGATSQVNVDVRVIAATNRDLAEFVRDGRFREDLFYRLSVFELIVPPLRDRDQDLNLLIDHFLSTFKRQHGRPNLELSQAARQQLVQYPWPGNVRQLRNVIDSAVVMADEPAITADDLGLRDAGNSQLDTLRIDQWEKRLIQQALDRTQGNVPDAAKLLGISRATAYRKIADYEIERK